MNKWFKYNAYAFCFINQKIKTKNQLKNKSDYGSKFNREYSKLEKNKKDSK